MMRNAWSGPCLRRASCCSKFRRVIMVSTPSCSVNGTTRLARRWVAPRKRNRPFTEFTPD